MMYRCLKEDLIYFENCVDFTFLFCLPASQGGLGIPQLKEQASIQFSASLNLTSAHRESIKDQDTCVREKNRDGHTQSTLRYHYQTLKLARLKGKTAAIHQALPQPLKPYMKQSQYTGASSWLNAIPKEDEDWVFSKQEFRDCVRLRYNHPIPDLPSYCVCKDKPVYTVQHAQQCSRGGGWSKALLALFACHPKFLASAKLFAVPKVPKVPNF